MNSGPAYRWNWTPLASTRPAVKALPISWVRLAPPALAMEGVYFLILRLSNLKENIEAVVALVFLQFLFYFVSLYWADKIAPQRSALVFLFVTAVVFRATLFPLYPSLSDDLYRYRWEGKVQKVGYNPYLVYPSDPRMAFLRDETYPNISGPQYPTLYGPLLEGAFWLTALVTTHPVAMKLPFVLLDLGIVLLLFRLLPRMNVSPLRAMVYAWSPLAIIEFAASGHNDTLPICALVLALLLWETRKQKASLIAISAAAVSKAYAVFLLPLFLRTNWRRTWIPLLIAAAAMLPYGEVWIQHVQNLSTYSERWRNNASLFALLARLTGSAQVTQWIYLFAIAIVLAYDLARRCSPARASFLIVGTILLLAPNVFPWYLTWLLPLLAIYPNPAWLLLTCTVFLSYHVLIPYRTLGLWREQPVYAILEYVPFFALLLGSFMRAQIQRWRRA